MCLLGKYSGLLTSKLKDVQDFIKNDVIGGLRGVVSGVRGLVPSLEQLPVGLPLADYYQTLFDSSFNAVDGLLQIAEATGNVCSCSAVVDCNCVQRAMRMHDGR